MDPVSRVTGRMAPIDRADVDTDQIIPKQFLKRIERTGYGPFLFFDWRAGGDFVLDKPEHAGASVLVTGANFGCGSSREHAPWALTDWGFRAVIARSFADIFKTNALKNGLLPVEVEGELHAWLRKQRALDPTLTVTIDLETTRLILPDGETVSFPIDPFARHCLRSGLDELTYLQEHEAQIQAFEARHG